MKKKVLLSVFAAALFASPAALANNDGQHYSVDDNKVSLTGDDVFGKEPAELTQYAKDGLNNVDADTTKAKFNAAGEKLVPKKDANGKVIPGQFVVEGKAKAAAKKMAPKAGVKPAGKVLPKTSAAK